LDQKETLLKENKYFLKKGLSALNEHLLKERTWQILRHISPMSIEETLSLEILNLLVPKHKL
jgi:hypothetical protein